MFPFISMRNLCCRMEYWYFKFSTNKGNGKWRTLCVTISKIGGTIVARVWWNISVSEVSFRISKLLEWISPPSLMVWAGCSASTTTILSAMVIFSQTACHSKCKRHAVEYSLHANATCPQLPAVKQYPTGAQHPYIYTHPTGDSHQLPRTHAHSRTPCLYC